MSSRCLRTLLLVLPLLAVACGDDSDEGVPPQGTPPTVREVQPTGGPIAGNTLLNVYGAGFQEGAKVFLGDLELQRTVVVNTFRIYGYTPTASSGAVHVRVVNPDGAYGALINGFTFEGPPAPNIDQAEVLNGNTDAVSGGQPVGITVRGAITVAGLTRGVGQAGGVRAEVGFAPGDAELLNPASYTWEAATYETDSDSGEADVYKGNVLLQPPIGGENREWVVTLRFSIDGGKTWVMADGDGIANGLSAAMMRRVFIARPRVDYCKLGPDGNGANPELFYRPGDTTLVKVAGQVYAAGITQGAGAGSGLVAQLGYGPADSDPRDSAAWTWVNATYKAEHGNNDEWEADLPNPGTEGTWRIAFRFTSPTSETIVPAELVGIDTPDQTRTLVQLDADATARAAMAVGHGGNILQRAADAVRVAIDGHEIPLIVRVSRQDLISVIRCQRLTASKQLQRHGSSIAAMQTAR